MTASALRPAALEARSEVTIIDDRGYTATHLTRVPGDLTLTLTLTLAPALTLTLTLTLTSPSSSPSPSP